MNSTIVLAKAVLRAEDGTILLLKRSETDERRPLQWDFPGGMVDEGENFVTAAVREIKEEAGIDIKPERLTLAYTTSAIREDKNVCWLIFVGETKKQDVKLSFEHSEFQWVSLDEAINAIEYDLQKNALIHIKKARLQK